MNNTDAISLISKVREKANRFIVGEMVRHGIEGIATSHGDILYALFNNEQLTMAEIAQKIGKDKSTVTVLVGKLVKLGYIQKQRGVEDTRVIYVSLTKKGVELKPIFDQISKDVLDTFYLNISEKEKNNLIEILSKIYDNL